MLQALTLAMIAITASCASATDTKRSRSDRSGTKHPYALLGEDYGVLTEDDLAINACDAPPKAFSPESTAYPYWQCFSAQATRFECDDSSHDENETTVVAILAITALKPGENHEYLSRRAVPLNECKEHLRDWKRLTANQRYVCISGPLIRIGKMTSGGTEGHWIFDKFKTGKGCDSYFKGGCSLKYQVKHGCKLADGVAIQSKDD